MRTSSDVTRDLELFEFVKGRKASVRVLKRLLPDVDTALFFAKALNMSYKRLTALISLLFNSPVIDALFNEQEAHSTELQDYIIDVVPEDAWPTEKRPDFVQDAPQAEFLPAVWDQIDVTVAQSIGTVAEKLSRVLDALPSKQGSMTFSHMARLNRQRPTIGTYAAAISHELVPDVLVILDVSASMSSETIRTIAGDVVEMAWKANATLAIVSDSLFYWEPGTYGVDDVLRYAEFSGTHYEKLAPLFDKDWGTVITVADYDSSSNARSWIQAQSKGRIGRVLDLSLVNRPTYLAEVVGVLADSVEPLLVAGQNSTLTGNW